MQNGSSDMNLFDFFVLIWRKLRSMCVAFGWFCLRCFRLAIHYYYITIVAFVLGIVAGWYWNKPCATRFTGTTTILFTRGMRSTVEQGLRMFASATPQEKIDLGMSPEVVESIKRINFFNVVDAKNDSVADYVDYKHKADMGDTVNVVMMDRIVMRVMLSGTNNFAEWQPAIKRFMHSQPAIAKADSIHKALELRKLEYFKHEVARTDSFMTYEYFRSRPYAQKEWGNMLITEREQELYNADMRWIFEQMQYNEAHVLATPDIVNFETPFVVDSMRRSVKYLITMALCMALGLAVSATVKYRAAIVEFFRQR